MRHFVTLLAALLAASPLTGQGSAVLRVRVVQDSTGTPITRAEVRLDSAEVVHTDSAGWVRITGIAPGERALKASRLGYRPQLLSVRLSPGADMEVEVALRESFVALPEMIAIAKVMDVRLRDVGFYLRRRRGGGVGWDWRELRESSAADVEAVLQRLPGFALRRLPGDAGWEVLSQRGPGLPEACAARVLLDGQPADARRLSGISVQHLAAVEAFAGPATTPAELAAMASGSRCGVVALWTRLGP